MPERTDQIWKGSALAATFLEGVRAAIPLAEQQIEAMLRLVAALERPLRRILDLGCGDGVLAAAILERFPDAEAVLVDFSEPMLEAARRRFAGRTAHVQFINADLGEASWTKALQGRFDAIVSGYAIHHQPDTRKRAVYREVFDLLEPGGMFINVEHVSSPSAWHTAINDENFVDHLSRYHPEKTRDEVSATYYKRPDKAANILAPVEAQCQWLREIGFVDVDCYLKVFELAVFGGRKA